jgi:glycosyltransferase involved in cell wall biosynthesis
MLITAIRSRHRYSVAHVDVYSGRAFTWAQWVGHILHFLGKPFIFSLHGGALPSFAVGREATVRKTLSLADAVTTPSPFLREEMKSYRPDIRMIPNGLDLSEYAFRVRKIATPRLIWLRAFHAIYDPLMAIRVTGILRTMGIEATLTMLGPDKGDGSLQACLAETASLGLENVVRIPGGVPKEDVPSWLDSADLFLNTTLVDNSPVSVHEAMACGLCVVSTNVGGLPYFLHHRENALLVPSRDVQAMATAVAELLTDRELAEQLSSAGRKSVSSHEWTRVLPDWERLLMNISHGTVWGNGEEGSVGEEGKAHASHR